MPTIFPRPTADDFKAHLYCVMTCLPSGIDKEYFINRRRALTKFISLHPTLERCLWRYRPEQSEIPQFVCYFPGVNSEE